MPDLTASSPRGTARLAGAFYLISAVPAGFSVFTFQRLVVRGDAVATATRILAAEGAFRLALVAEIVGVMFFTGSVLFFHRLFRPVSANLAVFLLSFGLLGAGIQVLDSLADIAALVMLKGGSGLTAIPIDQAQALAYLSLRMHMLIYNLAMAFFGVFAAAIGVLIIRSTFLPRFLGVLMVLDGFGYFLYSLSGLLSPPFAAHLYPFLPFGTALLGEMPLMIWLVVKSVNAERWREQAAGGAALRAAAPAP